MYFFGFVLLALLQNYQIGKVAKDEDMWGGPLHALYIDGAQYNQLLTTRTKNEFT